VSSTVKVDVDAMLRDLDGSGHVEEAGPWPVRITASRIVRISVGNPPIPCCP
jgi:hypothetical protein